MVPSTQAPEGNSAVAQDGAERTLTQYLRESHFVVGRKGWLFSDTAAGAHASAVIYSLVETAKANGLGPYTWLKRVLTCLPAAESVEEVEALLPLNLHPHDLATKLEI